MSVAAPTSRSAFVERLGGVLAEARVDHVVLHADDDTARRDSDVDIAIGREDVGLVDALLLSGALGPLVQRLHYDTPWCTYYVVETGDPERRYRQVDVACDPWGLNEQGSSISVALASGRSTGDTLPTPAAQTLYLLAKRAYKGLRGADDRDALVRSYVRDPAGSARLFARHLGRAGVRAAAELDRGTISPETLREVNRAVRRQRRRPALLLLRLSYSTRRLAGRLRRPTGLTVVVAGPDGTGKSTLAAALPAACSGAFRASRRFHLNPSVLPPPGRLLRRAPADTTAPHARAPSSPAGSLARLVYLWADAVLAWGPKVALPRRRSTLVVIERGWRDLEVDPARYRLGTSRRLTRAFGALLPRPDLVLVLTAPADAVTARKAELPAAELERQVGEWRRIAAGDPGRYVELDASKPPEQVLEAAARGVEDVLAARHEDLSRLDLVIRALGGFRSGGRPHTILSVRGQPRWVLPRGVGSRGPYGARLYRPFRARQAAGALALELLQRTGGARLSRVVPLALEDGLAGEIAATLGVRDVELTGMTTGDPDRGRRAVLSVRAGHRVVAFAKVADEERERLVHERAVLDLLAGAGLRTIVPPRVLGCFEWQQGTVLLLEPLPVRSFSDRPLADVELAALRELRGLAEVLAPVLGSDGAGVPIHGDFAPWNSGVLPGGRLAVWDWEETRLGAPLEDVFHWRVQRHLRGADASIEAIVADALGPGSVTTAAAAALGVDPASAPAALRTYLDRTLGLPPRINFSGVVALRERGLAMLAEVR
jgi:hypothetical protein